MSSESLADRAVAALAEVKAMGQGLDSDHPMRHAVRELKSVATQVLDDALNEAIRLAYLSERMVKDFDEAQKPDHKTNEMESALLWILYHHQGGSSIIGQPIRRVLGIGQHGNLTAEQLERAKKFGGTA